MEGAVCDVALSGDGVVLSGDGVFLELVGEEVGIIVALVACPGIGATGRIKRLVVDDREVEKVSADDSDVTNPSSFSVRPSTKSKDTTKLSFT